MKEVKSNNIIEDVRKQPFTKATFIHLQEAFKEVFADMLKGLTNSSGNIVALHGCVDSDASPTAWNISAGALLYSGEVYEIPAFIGTHVTNVPVLSVVTAYRGDDPVTFSDNNPFDVHEIRTMAWSMGVSGSGLADFAGVERWMSLLGDSFNYGINTDNAKLKFKKVDIGDWDLSANPSVDVPLGVDFSKILSISGVIRSDANNSRYVIGSQAVGATESDLYFAATPVITNAKIARKTGGIFDNSNFDSTPYNRGDLLIIYEA